ncbi:hypothetical protein D3C80_1300770 [compost metagenome]
MRMIAVITPNTMPSAMASTAMMIVLNRPHMIASEVRNWPMYDHSILPSAKARTRPMIAMTIRVAKKIRP